MKYFFKTPIVILSIIFVLLGPGFTPVSTPQMLRQTKENLSNINGQIVYSPMDSTETYLIDYTGNVVHQWSSDYLPGEAVYWMGNGTILRTIKTDIVGLGGAGGGVQMVRWDGTVTWDFRYNTNGNLSHHDVAILPNGNVLMLAWETKSNAEAISHGRDPSTLLADSVLPEQIIEVKPTGPTSGTIVWEWHAWDHLIQNFNPSKEDFGVVGDHPELIDFNYGGVIIKPDWLHMNSIDYNSKFDQILVSVRNFNEIWVIDHSTTTEEAAGHLGGNNGKGGDLLYRWGNPQTYHVGTSSDQKLFGQHDATWIESGCPGEGNILVFNNGKNQPSGAYSSVDEIVPPIDDQGIYSLEPGTPYEPEDQFWSYTGDPPSSFYSVAVSGAERLENGNTLICNGIEGRFFEVSPEETTVWEYTNQYPSPALNNVFKIDYIPQESPEPSLPDLECWGALTWTDIKPGATVNGTFEVQNIGDNGSFLNWTINISDVLWGVWSFTPESGKNLTPEEGSVVVQVRLTTPMEKNTEFSGHIRVENKDNPNDFSVISVFLKTSRCQNLFFQHFFERLFERFPHAFPILRYRIGY